MHVSEIFYSLQGEGLLAGVPSAFIRLAGCPLRCRWCDTAYAWDPTAGEDLTIDAVLDRISEWPTRYVVVTGGEPMVQSDVAQLTRQLKGRDKHVTIETAGIAYVPDVRCDLMSISPKLSNSIPTDSTAAAAHEAVRLDIAVLSELLEHFDCQLKFVMESPADLEEVEQLLSKLDHVDPAKVLLMPRAATRDELLAGSPLVADMCKQTGFAFCQRLQILLWNGRRAT